MDGEHAPEVRMDFPKVRKAFLKKFTTAGTNANQYWIDAASFVRRRGEPLSEFKTRADALATRLPPDYENMLAACMFNNMLDGENGTQVWKVVGGTLCSMGKDHFKNVTLSREETEDVCFKASSLGRMV
jgi:hypothetical protein